MPTYDCEVLVHLNETYRVVARDGEAALREAHARADHEHPDAALVDPTNWEEVSPDNAHQGFVVPGGPWPGTCERCGAAFEGIRPGMTLCHGCWYSGEMEAAERLFAPLADAVRHAGWRTEVWQTGGMVMCLAGFPPPHDKLPYCMWGDPEEHGLSFCVYVQDEDTCQDLFVEVPHLRDVSQIADVLLTTWEELVALAGTEQENARVLDHKHGWRVAP